MMLFKNCEAVMVRVLRTLEVPRWDTSLSLISGDQGLLTKTTPRSGLEE